MADQREHRAGGDRGGRDAQVYGDPGLLEQIVLNLCVNARDAMPGGGETILVAEDEETVRELLVRLLERKGYTVVQAGDGPTAWALFDERRDDIDMVISDMVMPKSGGRELFEHVRQVRPDLPVLLCTGYTAELLDAEFVKARGENLIRKPYTPHQLYAAVRRNLDRQPG